MQTRARVRVTLDVDAGSHWNDSCSVAQIFEQAAAEATRRIYNALQSSDCRIIGKPTVDVVTSASAPAAGGE